MKKYIPYALSLILAAALVTLFLTGNKNKEKQFDDRVTLRQKDKIPYGTYIAYRGLKYLFPNAGITNNKFEPGSWDSLSVHQSGQALIIITGKFNADESEMKNLLAFIEEGNEVFVSARTISYSATEILKCRVNTNDISSFSDEGIIIRDSLAVYLGNPPFPAPRRYVYPGKKLDASFAEMDNTTTEVLGEDELGRPNFIRLRAGKGNIFIHLAPMAFTNYFLLHKENIGYYEKALSVLNKQATRVVWDEYFLNKKFLEETNGEKHNWFNVLSRYPALKAALLTGIFAILLYVLLELRRKQRIIPEMKRPRNDSLDFVKTIGRLYFDKGDHKNLCRKMSAYFLEHVRNKYKLLTGTLDEEFIKKLQYKSGAAEEEIRGIVSFIRYLDDTPEISQHQLNGFHKQLESFYKKA